MAFEPVASATAAALLITTTTGADNCTVVPVVPFNIFLLYVLRAVRKRQRLSPQSFVESVQH